jgi:hypothetical protein
VQDVRGVGRCPDRVDREHYAAGMASDDEVTGRSWQPQFPSERVTGRGRAWYRGDCHVHSVLSHAGELTVEQLADCAREVGLDFVATTEHNTSDAHGLWAPHAGDDLLVILGQEVVTRTGHWLALGIGPGRVVDWRYGVRDDVIDRHLEQVHHGGGLCVAAHPYAPYVGGEFMYPYQGFDAVEVWNGLWTSDRPWNADNEAALAEWGRSLAADIHGGRWRPAIGNSDVHLEGQLGTPQTVVLADELSTGAVLAGIRAGRCWVAESAAVGLSLEVSAGGRRAGAGEQLDTGGEPAQVRVDVRGVPSGAVSFHTDRGQVHREMLPDDGSGTLRWRTSAEESAFVRVEVRHPGGHMAALNNPIILTCSSGSDPLGFAVSHRSANDDDHDMDSVAPASASAISATVSNTPAATAMIRSYAASLDKVSRRPLSP